MCARTRLQFLLPLLLTPLCINGKPVALDEAPARAGEWGYRPKANQVLAVNPPSFVWRFQEGLTWEIQCAKDASFSVLAYDINGLDLNVHCPARVFPPGSYVWRYRGVDERGNATAWSRSRTFTIPTYATTMPLPSKEALLKRIPRTHPRLFLRPENLERLRQLASTSLASQYQDLVRQCEDIMQNPPDTQEPPLYPEGMVRGSDPWRKIWWGNRTYTIRTLNSAATLAFTRLLGAPNSYGHQAKRILLACAKWKPTGSTGYRYNDEAGMPYNYYFSRTYSFVNDLLTEQEKERCRSIMKVRGQEMYRHLCPRHLWTPFASHSNRAWHFLGEMGIAFFDEIEEAQDWLWFATNVFHTVYPAWCDDDGGWHEGASYWLSYQNRFTWWADVMREALGINAFDKPYYAQAGYYAMYLLPPGKTSGGFGDLCAGKTAASTRPLMSVFAAQAQNPHWQWYVDQLGGGVDDRGYIGFIRGALPLVAAQAPQDLPASRIFTGIGQAFLNTQITDAQESVQIAFKSSPFGTQSHGYEANNAFLLWAYGKRLLIRSGRRDSYGSNHHRNWMWSTRSVNSITVNGQGQTRRSAAALGEIIRFETTPDIDLVVGEAGQAYETPLKRFTRAVIFVKPELMIVYDRLAAPESSTYSYWLHALNEMKIQDQHHITVRNDDVLCDIDFLSPKGLSLVQTNQYDPNPRERIKLREWHLSASTDTLQKNLEFVTLYRIHRQAQAVPHGASLKQIPGGYLLNAKISDGQVTALLPTDESSTLRHANLETTGRILIQLRRENQPQQTLTPGRKL
jgi:hypothetical protein